MAMPLSLSANTSTSSGAGGGYASNRGQLSGTNITNVVPDAAGNVIWALTGAQSMVSPLTGSASYGSSGTPVTVANSGTVSSGGISPLMAFLGIGALAFFLGKGGKL